MNILFFYRVYPNYGGVEVVTTVLANRFIKDGHGVIIASIEQPHIYKGWTWCYHSFNRTTAY